VGLGRTDLLVAEELQAQAVALAVELAAVAAHQMVTVRVQAVEVAQSSWLVRQLIPCR
jgi:hypothetical protein